MKGQSNGQIDRPQPQAAQAQAADQEKDPAGRQAEGKVQKIKRRHRV
jgi:hypothetical protein